MLFCSSEGGAEGAFQVTDNSLRLSESIGLEEWSSFNDQITAPDAGPAMNQFNQASIVPDGINFTPPPGGDIGINAMPGLESSLMPGGDLSMMAGPMSAMPGGLGLLTSFFQALGSFITGAITSTGTELAKNYAVASQATLEGAKSLAQ